MHTYTQLKSCYGINQARLTGSDMWPVESDLRWISLELPLDGIAYGAQQPTLVSSCPNSLLVLPLVWKWRLIKHFGFNEIHRPRPIGILIDGVWCVIAQIRPSLVEVRICGKQLYGLPRKGQLLDALQEGRRDRSVSYWVGWCSMGCLGCRSKLVTRDILTPDPVLVFLARDDIAQGWNCEAYTFQ